MGIRTDKRKKRWVDRMRDRLKLTCIIHGPGHYLDELKVLNRFGNKYYKGNNFKERMQDTSTKRIRKEERGK